MPNINPKDPLGLGFEVEPLGGAEAPQVQEEPTPQEQAPTPEEPEEKHPLRPVQRELAQSDDSTQTSQQWNILDLDYSKYGELYPAEEKRSPFDPRKTAAQIRTATPKIGAKIKQKEDRKKRFGFDAAIDHYEGNELGITADEAARNTVNFLIGDDLAVLGFEWNKEGFSMNMDNLVQTWSEEPLWQNGLRIASLALNFVPFAGAAAKSMKFGKLGKYMPAKSFKYVDPVDGAKSFRWFEHFNTPEDEMRWMVQQGRVTEGATDEAVRISRSVLAAEQRANKMRAMERALEAGEAKFQWAGEWVDIGAVDRAKLAFQRNFANTYWAATNTTDKAMHGKFLASLDNFYKAENFGRYFSGVPKEITNPAFQQRIHKYMQSGNHRYLGNKVTPEGRAYLKDMKQSYESHQKEWFELGAIDEDTLAEIPRHVPTQRPGTAQPNLSDTTVSVIQDAASGKVIARPQIGQIPRMGAPTLKRRGTREIDKILNKIDNGEIISDVQNHMLPNFMLDRTLLHNFKFMKDAIKEMPGLAVTADDMARAGKTAQKYYIDLERHAWDGKETLRRILTKHAPEKLGANGELPNVSKAVFKEWMGKSGMMEQSRAAKGILEAMVTFHKTMKTAGNLPTQLNNIMGNMVMQNWAGYNPLSPKNLLIGSQFAKAFRKHAQQIKKAAKGDGVTPATGMASVEVVNEAGKTSTYKIADLLNDGIFKDLIEESAFQNVEGLKHLEKIHKTMRKDTLSAKAVNAMMRTKGLPGVNTAVDEATEMYLMADMIPKAQLYVQYLSEGMSKTTAAGAVSRTLPMYATTGRAIQAGRKALVPWATFPTEMTRIMKNTLQDNPMRILPWINMSSALQSMGYIYGGAEGFEETQETMKSLPSHAQTGWTVAGKASFTDLLQSVPSGAVLGGVAGTIAGAPATGAALGAAGGAALSLWQNHDKETEALRGAVLRWLPHTSTMLGTNAPEMMNRMTGREFAQQIKKGEVGEALTALMPGKDLRTTGSIMPAQPLAIFEPLINIMSGKTAYGSEIKAESPADMMAKTMAGFIGFMAPPAIQTYGYRQTSPTDEMPGGAIFGAVGGAIAGGTAGGVPGAIAGGTAGAILGASSNVSRIAEDTGWSINPRTMHQKNTYEDFILNNFGALKSYAAIPETRAANMKMNEQVIQDQRTAIKKQASYYFINNREEKAVKYLSMAHKTFDRQYPTDPRMAEQKFSEWMENFIDTVGESPLWGGLSKEEMKKEMLRARRNLGDMRSRALREWLGGLEAARANK